MREDEIIKALELLEFCKSIARRGEDVLLTPDTIFSIDKIIKSKDKQLEAVKLMHINDVKKKDAEIERLKPFEEKIAEYNSSIRVEDMLVFASSLEEWLEFCDNLKAEAYKEFAEKLIAKAEIVAGSDYGFVYEIGEDDIDILLAEMEERE